MIKALNKKTGWIGIDIGTSHLKVVQLARTQGRLRLAATAIVPRSTAWNAKELTEEETVSSAEELIAATSLRPDFRGRCVAATLPMALCQFHQMQYSPNKSAQSDSAIRQSIESSNQQSARHLQFASWPAEHDKSGVAPVRTNVLAVPQVWSDQLCDDISRAGWSCQLVDGLPLALARAVKMVHQSDPLIPWAALDWGYSQATFCVVVDGRAVYVRSLKHCGLRLLLDSITEELGVASDEALRLLRDYGLPSVQTNENSEVVAELIADPLDNLQQEIARTISHLQGLRHTIVPQGVYLFGGGATVKGLAEYLTEKLTLEHRVWQFHDSQSVNSTGSGLHNCMLGPAIALSALAWEQS